MNNTETNIVGQNQRAFVCAFTSLDDLRWSSEFGFGPSNGIYSVATSDEFIYAAGISEEAWTLWEYDTASELDYFLAELGENDPSDGTIARYNMQTTVGIEEGNLIESANEFMLFPNPTVGETWLNSSQPMEVGTSLIIYDAQGQLVYQQTVKARAKQISLSVESLSSGFYTCVVASSEKLYHPISFIKQ